MKVMMYGPQRMPNLMNGPLSYVLFALSLEPASGSRWQLLYTNSTSLEKQM